MKKKTNEEKEKKSELTGLTHQTRLTVLSVSLWTCTMKH